MTVIEKAIADAHYSVHPTRSAKQQALTVIQLLKETIPIERAQMRLHVSMPSKSATKIKTTLHDMFTKVEDEDFGAMFDIVSYS